MRDRPGRRRHLAAVAVAAGAVLSTLTSTVATAGAATAVDGAPLAVSAGVSTPATAAFPAHVFAPYFETYQTQSPAALAARSGARYLTLAFLQVPVAGGCEVTWNGDPSRPVTRAVYGSDITAIRRRGGDVIASFGGYSADHAGTDIADSCPSAARVAASYERVVATYGLRRIDLDVEDASLTDRAGIARRNAAVALLQRWARAHRRQLEVSYTLPSTTTGLDAAGLAVLADAHRRGVRLDVVDLMTFDFFDAVRHDMRAAAETAAAGLAAQLGRLLPRSTAASRWGRVGITVMIGVDDAGRKELLRPAGAVALRRWAGAHGVDTLSFWSLQRDNGRCPAGPAVDTCSGIVQSRWQFTHLLAPFGAP